MQFKQYLNELANIEVGQAIVAHEPTDKESSSIDTPKVFAEINYRLTVELNDMILAPNQGLQKIRKVLHRFSLDMPALYEINPMGDEIIIPVQQFGQAHGVTTRDEITSGFNVVNSDPDVYLYFVYFLEDNGQYVFHAEILSESDLNQLFSDEEIQGLEEIY